MGKNIFVEITRMHEMLDYLRIKGKKSLDGLLDGNSALGLSNVSVIAKSVSSADLATITVGKFRLALSHEGFSREVEYNVPILTDREKIELIQNDLDTAFLYLVRKHSDYTYLLGVYFDNYYIGGPHEGEFRGLENDFGNKPYGSQCPPKILGRHLSYYMPIIQKFIVDALTDNLYVIEDGKLVKQ